MTEAADASLLAKIETMLQQPIFFRDILAAVRSHPYRAILQAWSDIRTRRALMRDEFGRYWLEKS